MKACLSSTAFLALAIFPPRLVSVGAHGGDVNYLLRTNALNYQDNMEIDTKIQGRCSAGTPSSKLKADAQTTRSDEKCKELVRSTPYTIP